MTERPPYDPDTLADRLDALLGGGAPLPADDPDPLVQVALSLAEAPHPELSPEAMVRIEAQVMDAARRMPGAPAPAQPLPRVLLSLLVGALVLTAVISTIVISGGPTAVITPTDTPTASLTVTTTPTETPTVTAAPTLTPTPTPSIMEPVTAQPEEAIDCSNPPPPQAPALGWREQCEDGPDPSEVIPGDGNSGGGGNGRGNSSGRGNPNK